MRRFSVLSGRYERLFVTQTRASGHHALTYMRGLMQARRRNIQSIRDAVPQSDEQALHHFISNSPWDARAVMDQIARDANALLGGSEDSFLLIDESGFPKKGRESVGVARQWCGRLGKVDNCQTAVFASLGRGSIATVIDVALFLPQEWTRDRSRMKRAGVPSAEQIFRTKHDLAFDLIERAVVNGLDFSWIGFDGFYGENGKLLRTIDTAGMTFMADVHRDQRIWTSNPAVDQNATPVRVDQWLEQQPKKAWQRVVLREGTKGPMEVELLHARVWLYQKGDQEANLWHLVVRREANRLKFSLSNASEDTPMQRLGYMQGQRYFVERAIQDAKQQGGLGEYQVRNWRGWHHHIALVMLAMLFLTQERVETGEATLTAADVQMMLVHYLPRRGRTEDDMLEMLRRRLARRGETIPYDSP